MVLFSLGSTVFLCPKEQINFPRSNTTIHHKFGFMQIFVGNSYVNFNSVSAYHFKYVHKFCALVCHWLDGCKFKCLGFV